MKKSVSVDGAYLCYFAALLVFALSLAVFSARAQADPRDYFRITVVDADTGRGVPLVELKTTNEVRFWTDSNGIVAINEPDLMGQKVYFHIRSDGYEYSKDMFGNRGVAFQVTRGGQEQIKLKRLNIAERLYRITGAGIYRDSVLVGALVPLKQPLLNGQVMGQDTVMSTPYKGKIFWLWGDTNRPSYPLGNFSTSSATSLLPGHGGLDPSAGIDLTYWDDSEGFSKKMMPMEGGMPVWMGGLFSLRQANEQELLFARYAQVKSDSQVNEQGLALFNDDKAVFEKAGVFNAALLPDGHPFQATANGQSYLYFQPSNSSEAAPLLRIHADKASILDPQTYQSFTCLPAGARYDKAATRLDRDASGKLIYNWKTNTPPLNHDQRQELIADGKMTGAESLFQLRDIETDAPIQSHGGSVFWNAFRHRWIMISGQAGGSPSYLGELWFAEADTPVGPWVYAKKILTHDKYTFYNPTQHPFFDQDNGRLIYFEGTYTSTYSGNDDKTPRYDYNQIMYRLALDDARLALPSPVYALKEANGANSDAMRETIAARHQWNQVTSVAFFAVPTTRPHAGLIPIYGATSNSGTDKSMTLQTSASAGEKPLFYALPTNATSDEKPSPAVVPLWEYHDARDGKRWYSTDANGQTATITHAATPLCRVWRNPSTILALDTETKAETTP